MEITRGVVGEATSVLAAARGMTPSWGVSVSAGMGVTSLTLSVSVPSPMGTSPVEGIGASTGTTYAVAGVAEAGVPNTTSALSKKPFMGVPIEV